MNTNLHVTLKEVAQIARENYVRFHTRTDFTDILKQLLHTSLVSDIPYKFRSADRFLTAEEFKIHVFSSSVRIDPILLDHSSFIINENHLFSGQRDIFTMMHLPYIKANLHVHNYFELNYVYTGSYSQIFSGEKKTSARVIWL